MGRLIDADKLKESCSGVYHNYRGVMAIIDRQPTADPVVHARWICEQEPIIDPLFGPHGGAYLCSSCHSLLSEKYKYCPECGAMMNEEPK